MKYIITLILTMIFISCSSKPTILPKKVYVVVEVYNQDTKVISNWVPPQAGYWSVETQRSAHFLIIMESNNYNKYVSITNVTNTSDDEYYRLSVRQSMFLNDHCFKIVPTNMSELSNYYIGEIIKE